MGAEQGSRTLCSWVMSPMCKPFHSPAKIGRDGETRTPTTLSGLGFSDQVVYQFQHVTINGRGNRIRTCDLMLPKHALHQLSYSPMNLDFTSKGAGV